MTKRGELQGNGASRLMAVNQPKKKQSLRNNEYYNTQELFDDLYEKSQHSEVFTHLMELIISEQNILLAYRAIKNKGSKTKGVNSTTIVEMGENDRRNWLPTCGRGCKIFILTQYAVLKFQNRMDVCARWVSPPWKTA